MSNYTASSPVSKPLTNMAGIVVVFDFDKTIIDCDSDNWVVDELGFTNLLDELLPTMPWNSLMDRMMKEIHLQGKTMDYIARVLKRAPIHPRVVPAIKTARAFGCDLRIVSDANMFFIETILEHLGIKECFSEINSNPGFVDEEGRLRILPYHDFHSAPHACTVGTCPPNMCKGKVIERIQSTLDEKTRMIYLGDGKGDYCPSLKLRERYYMMPRKDFPVWELICRNPMLVNAQIHEWTDGEDLERVLIALIHRICLEGHGEDDQDSSFLISTADLFKFQTISASGHQTNLLQAVSVPQ